MAAQMHYRDDENQVSAKLVHHSVRETLGATPSSPFRKPVPRIWESENAGESLFGLCGEFVAKPFALLVVVRDGVQQVYFRCSEYFCLHLSCCRSIRSKTS